jgi:hypothetical protein
VSVRHTCDHHGTKNARSRLHRDRLTVYNVRFMGADTLLGRVPVPMKGIQVVLSFTRHVGAGEEVMDRAAVACHDALSRDARFVAFGPVVSVNYATSSLEVEFTAYSKHGTCDEVNARTERVQQLVFEALSVADYAASSRVVASLV